MRRGSAECVGRKRLLRRAARVVIRTRHPAGDSGTGDVPHWSFAGRAGDRRNPGNASTGKAPGRTPRELGSAVIRAPFDQLRRASEKVAGAEALGKAREEEKTPAPPQPSINLWQPSHEEYAQEEEVDQRPRNTLNKNYDTTDGDQVLTTSTAIRMNLATWCIPLLMAVLTALLTMHFYFGSS
ncbi:hypothetical protein NDU88_001551 [Pleurodeles waltl]|uniref:Uncharacterized protein n=1 Tax=Pleurodeles waltl TaxID=8319 RepID=A0AAV7KSA0_PLEWA|nr:hypothetical protein NDU88_001551 [Pleurodeles waltl]